MQRIDLALRGAGHGNVKPRWKVESEALMARLEAEAAAEAPA